MKTDAPGSFDCEIYLKAWQLEIRDEYVMDHIDHCWFCGPIVHGDGRDFPLSIEQEATARLAARHRARRRRFLKYSAASVIGLAAAAAGLYPLFRRRSNLDDMVTRTYKDLDTRLNVTDVDGMYKYYKRCSEQEAVQLVTWIAERQKRRLYDLLVMAAEDSREQVRMTAGLVMMMVDPADLQDFLPDLRRIRSQESDRTRQRTLRIVITAVENS